MNFSPKLKEGVERLYMHQDKHERSKPCKPIEQLIQNKATHSGTLSSQSLMIEVSRTDTQKLMGKHLTSVVLYVNLTWV